MSTAQRLPLRRTFSQSRGSLDTIQTDEEDSPRRPVRKSVAVLALLSGAVLLLVLVTLLGGGEVFSRAAPTQHPLSSFFWLSSRFASHAVLPRSPASASLWGGGAVPGSRVLCSLSSGAASSRASAGSSADERGEWTVSLPPQPAGGSLTLTCSNSEASVRLTDVTFGDVWLCAGQSNVALPVSDAFNASAELAAASSYPHVRLLALSNATATQRGPAPQLPWSRASAAVLTDSRFSALCWSFGRSLADTVGGDIPIGIIVAAASGSCGEHWAPDGALRACEQPEGQGFLFDSMIAPLAPPFGRLSAGLAGALWYQGESNVGTAGSHKCGAWGSSYQRLLPALVSSWRAALAQPQLPMLVVQLAPFSSPFAQAGEANRSAVADLRHAQAAACASLASCWLVSAVDFGDAESPLRDVHPREKARLGERAAAAVGAVLHSPPGKPEQELSPVFHSARLRRGEAGAEVLVALRGEGGAMVQRSAQCPASVQPEACAGWQLRAAGGDWVAAGGARLEQGGRAVAVSERGDGGASLLGVRYLWSDWPLPTLFSQAGMPVLPAALDVDDS